MGPHHLENAIKRVKLPRIITSPHLIPVLSTQLHPDDDGATGYEATISYELPHRIHSAQLYPIPALNGSTIIIYAHDRGLRILWRGGRRRGQAPKTATQVNGSVRDPDIIIIDDDEEEEETNGGQPDDEFDEEEDELDPDCPYPSIIQDADIELGVKVLHLAVPSLPSAIRKSYALSQQGAVVMSCSDYSQRVLSFDLLPPTDTGRRDYVRRVQRQQIRVNVSPSPCTGLAAKIVVYDSSQSEHEPGSTSFLLVAATADTLQFYRFVIFEDLSNVSQDAQTRTVHVPHSAKNLTFHPSTTSTSMLLSDASGAIRIYDPFTTEADDDGKIAETMLENTESTVSSSGKWLFAFATSYTSNSGAIPRRKQVLDAAWILNGSAIVILLEDGEWCIYSLNPEAHPNTDPADPILSGYLGAASDMTRQPKTTASRLSPMTPNTRQAKAETFFASHPKAAGAAAQGGLAIVTSSMRAGGQENESVILWYNSEIYSIPSLQTFYQRSTTNKTGSGGGGLGSLYAPGLTHITDVNLMNERITSIAQSAPPAASSGVGQMNTQRDILVAGEHRLVVLQTLRPASGAPRSLFQPASTNTATAAGAEAGAEQAVSRDQTMLDAGHLDLGGMDRLLEGMASGAGASRPRRVGFAR
ncbi:hypothetical protein LTS09_008219 [Friedmanniomyces endolithicus]|nr:hypothetical protein LTS09_008219 [Friedmanniomyces endolithicus]